MTKSIAKQIRVIVHVIVCVTCNSYSHSMPTNWYFSLLSHKIDQIIIKGHLEASQRLSFSQ